MKMILQIETATASCSVALSNNGNTIAVKQVNARNIHAEVITLFIDELIASGKIQYADLDAIAVSCGPGSYTGLRIGISTAKGLCFALDKPLIAIETLEAMAYGVINSNAAIAPNTLLCPMIDARRMEVFTAVYNQQIEILKPVTAEIITETSFEDILRTHTILFFGDGAEKCRPVLGANPNAQFLPGFENSAAHLTQKAFEKFKNKDFEDVVFFEPHYLKEFIAGKKAI